MKSSIGIGSAEISRRTLLAAVAAAGSAPILAASVTPAMAKIAQTAVGYQDSPKGDRSCSNCNLFQPPSSCKTVDGTISPNGWCKIWVKKAA
jgi:anaerobic selenocysteine-containing dehydrogenase